MAEQKEKKQPQFCPYCDEEVPVEPPTCQTCGITIFYCPKCREPVSRENRECPHCGAEIRGEIT